MSRNIFILLIFISINFCLNKKKSLVLPYKIFFPPEDDKITKEQIYLSIERNYFYTLMEIGNPPKKIPMFFNFNDSSLSFQSDLKFLSILESSYTPSNSQSLKIENQTALEDVLFDIEDVTIIKNLSFIYPNLKKDDLSYYINVGLQNFYKDIRKKNITYPNFLYQLKNLGLIDYMSFSINQTSDLGGFININLEPNEYAKEIYSNKSKYTMLVKGAESKLINKLCGEYLWNFDLSLVYYKNYEKKTITVNIDHFEIKKYQYTALLNPAYGLIKGPYEFKNLMKNDFFGEFMKTNICTNSQVNNLYFYSCDAKYKKILKEKFPPIYFYLLELNNRFVLDFDDLFYERNGILFFLICYDGTLYGQDKFSQISEWVLGKPFFNKYQFSFDVEKNKVTFYENKEGYSHQKMEIKKKETDKENLNKKKMIKEKKEKELFINKLLPDKNLGFISLSLFIIFVAFLCIFYNLRVNHKKIEEEKKLEDEKNKIYVELKENLDNDSDKLINK